MLHSNSRMARRLQDNSILRVGAQAAAAAADLLYPSRCPLCMKTLSGEEKRQPLAEVRDRSDPAVFRGNDRTDRGTPEELGPEQSELYV